ncbi:MAG: hypothetical protein K9M45_12750 [Kiritimatiellales bacterium]|nr:hypothetical protein [Kiritimatiellales bacterium]
MKKTTDFVLSAFALTVLLLIMAGCTTTDPDREYSDMPWNTPQTWEGSRSIPGMTPQY